MIGTKGAAETVGLHGLVGDNQPVQGTYHGYRDPLGGHGTVPKVRCLIHLSLRGAESVMPVSFNM